MILKLLFSILLESKHIALNMGTRKVSGRAICLTNTEYELGAGPWTGKWEEAAEESGMSCVPLELSGWPRGAQGDGQLYLV